MSSRAAKLDPRKQRLVLQLHAAGMTQAGLARALLVPLAAVRRVVAAAKKPKRGRI